MPKRKTPIITSFGERLASLRKEAGFTQVELAQEVGITQRMIAYYEAPNAPPPAHLLPQLAETLGISVDVLLGIAEPRRIKRLATNRLERRLLEIDKLDPRAKRQLTALLDTFIEGEKLKQRMNAQQPYPRGLNMTTIQIDLPDALAQEAAKAGLLNSAAIENFLRTQLRIQAGEALRAMWAQAPDEEITPEIEEMINEEVRIVRAEKRAERQAAQANKSS
jgi:transcriptional regulator with XRE-family HTH domain